MKKGIITEIIVEKGTIDNAVVSDTTLENVKISMRNYGEGSPPTGNVAEGQIYFQILNNE
jgi:hypothetical protein